MRDINELYTKYLEDRAKLEKEYDQQAKDIRDDKLEKCRLKKGMAVSYRDWVGRIIFVEYIGFLEDQHLQAMLMDSKSITRIPIPEIDFDLVNILEESNTTVNMSFINESILNIKAEKLAHELALKVIVDKHELILADLVKDLDILRKDCLHDWKLLKANGSGGYVYRCEICKEERTRQL